MTLLLLRLQSAVFVPQNLSLLVSALTLFKGINLQVSYSREQQSLTFLLVSEFCLLFFTLTKISVQIHYTSEVRLPYITLKLLTKQVTERFLTVTSYSKTCFTKFTSFPILRKRKETKVWLGICSKNKY